MPPTMKGCSNQSLAAPLSLELGSSARKGLLERCRAARSARLGVDVRVAACESPVNTCRSTEIESRLDARMQAVRNQVHWPAKMPLDHDLEQECVHGRAEPRHD